MQVDFSCSCSFPENQVCFKQHFLKMFTYSLIFRYCKYSINVRPFNRYHDDYYRDRDYRRRSRSRSSDRYERGRYRSSRERDYRYRSVSRSSSPDYGRGRGRSRYDDERRSYRSHSFERLFFFYYYYYIFLMILFFL